MKRPIELEDRPKSVKRVRIAENCNQSHCIPAHDETEIGKRWMCENESDYSQIKQDICQTLRTFLKSWDDVSRLDVNECCLRGLEKHIEFLCTRTRQESHKDSVQVVLLDQTTMRTNGSIDPEVLAETYRERTKQSKRRALQLAYVDALG